MPHPLDLASVQTPRQKVTIEEVESIVASYLVAHGRDNNAQVMSSIILLLAAIQRQLDKTHLLSCELELTSNRMPPTGTKK